MNKNLAIILSGQLISQVGDKFYMLALSYWVLDSTGSATMMGVVMFASIFPETVLGLAAGAYVDRYDRRTIIVGSDFLRGLVILAVAWFFYMDLLTIPLIILSQVILSINTAFFNPAIPAIIPQIVSEDKLAKANSQTQLIRGISLVVGPVLGGISVVQFGYLFVFLFNAGSFIFSGLFEMLLNLPKNTKDREASTIVDDIVEGFQFIKNDRALIALIACIAIIHFFVGAIHTITPVFANYLTGQGAQNMGYLQTAFGLGMMLTSLLFGVFNYIDNREKLFLFGAIYMIGAVNSIAAVMVYFDFNQVWQHVFVFFAFGGFIIIAVTSFRTLVQKSIPNEMAGRVFGVAFSAGDVSIPLAMLIFGFLMDRMDFSHLLLISGISLMVICLFLYKQAQATDKLKTGEVAI